MRGAALGRKGLGEPGGEVEQDRRGHDGHRRQARRHRQPLAPGRERGGHRVARAKPQRGAAREDHRVQAPHQVLGREDLDLPRAGAAAAHVGAGGDAAGGEDHGDAGRQIGVARVADAQARDVGQQVARAGADGSGHADSRGRDGRPRP
tara:strand:+ start:15297 stop:15743 length:447 start_codon:yes stop_codon:yes gene_type:complete